MLVCTGSHIGGRPQAGTATCRTGGCQKRGLFTPWDQWTPAGTVTVFLNANPRCVFLEIKNGSVGKMFMELRGLLPDLEFALFL